MRRTVFACALVVLASCSEEPMGPETPTRLPIPNTCLAFRCSFSPRLVTGAGPFQRINASRFESCGLTAGGALMCWGLVAGAIGSDPTLVHEEVSFETIASGDSHHCGLASTGQVHCWGTNGSGQLGSGDELPARYLADTVAAPLRFTRVAAGFRHSCGLTLEGEAYCWGSNLQGELGVETASQSCNSGNVPCETAPAPVATDLRFVDIVAGSFYTCALATDGTAYCWGDNIESETTAPNGGPEPRVVDSFLRFTTLSGGGSHACGLTTSGQGYCWGNSAALDGALGNPEESAGAVPVVGGLTFDSMVSGQVHNCGLTSDGEAYCWGSNRVGQLAAFTTSVCFGYTCSRVPIRAASDLRFVALAAGADHTCGVTDAGETYCWGADSAGQLGPAEPSSSASGAGNVPTSGRTTAALAAG